MEFGGFCHRFNMLQLPKCVLRTLRGVPVCTTCVILPFFSQRFDGRMLVMDYGMMKRSFSNDVTFFQVFYAKLDI